MIIGLDVGGTHTDVVLLDRQGVVRDIKVPTDAANLFSTVLEGLERVMEGVDPEAVRRVVLSTTLTTNAIVQKKIPEVGIIVSSGPGIDPRYFQTNEHYFPVSGSIDHRGREVEPVDPGEIEKVGRELQSRGINHVGVVGKFSVRNPVHELAIKAHLGDAFEKVFLGHLISGHLNFPRRIATTYLNASVYPVHKEFFEAVQQSLETRGLSMPIRILKADGGNMNFASSIEFPGQTILSGPAASVMGAVAYAYDTVDSLVMDIGGTTTDMTILTNRVPLLAPVGINVGEYRTLIRSLDTHSIGVGGDSLVRLSDQRLEVGPERLGPAMAHGGPKPTPTDALFVLDKVENGDREKAVQGIEPMAASLGLSVEEAAVKIVERTCAKIIKAANAMLERLNSKPVYTIHEIQEGGQAATGADTYFGRTGTIFSGGTREAVGNGGRRCTQMVRGQCHRSRPGANHQRGDPLCRYRAGNEHGARGSISGSRRPRVQPGGCRTHCLRAFKGKSGQEGRQPRAPGNGSSGRAGVQHGQGLQHHRQELAHPRPG